MPVSYFMGIVWNYLILNINILDKYMGIVWEFQIVQIYYKRVKSLTN